MNGVAIKLDHIGTFTGDVLNASGASITGTIVVGTHVGPTVFGITQFTGSIINAGTVSVRTGVQYVNGAYLRNASGFLDEMEEGQYVTLEVQDDGCGMDEEIKSRIFDPFFTTKFTGRGLGLAAVRGIIRRHKGGLQMHSAPGEGTTFKVWLPAARGGVAPPKADLKTARRDLRGKATILVVDDEEMVRNLAERAEAGRESRGRARTQSGRREVAP